jgi:predicted neuraminidase
MGINSKRNNYVSIIPARWKNDSQCDYSGSAVWPDFCVGPGDAWRRVLIFLAFSSCPDRMPRPAWCMTSKFYAMEIPRFSGRFQADRGGERDSGMTGRVPFRFLLQALPLAGIVCLTLWAGWPAFFAPPPPRFALPALPASQPGQTPRLESALINQPDPVRVHAAAITALPDGGLFAVWYGGSREGSMDARIYAADYRQGAWSPQRVLATLAQTMADTGRFARKVGNPVAFVTPQGELWVVYVSVALGGWATSQLNLIASPDLGRSWQPARRLVIEPFLNISTLVKGPPLFFENGDVGLPVYYEMAGKLGELLTLSPEGEVRRVTHMDHGRRSLQPIVLVETPTRAVSLMRDGDDLPPNRVWRTETTDAGQHWSPPAQTDLPNPNSAISALRLEDGRLLAVANDVEDDRFRLSLLVSADDGRHWRAIHRFEDKESFLLDPPDRAAFRARLLEDMQNLGRMPDPEAVVQNVEVNLCETYCRWQYGYPYLVRAADGDFHLVYTWNDGFIRHLRFNRAWLEKLL